MKEEEYSPSFAEISEYISRNLPFDKNEILFTLENSQFIYKTKEGRICGVLVFDKQGTHVHFFCAESPEIRKDLVIQGLINGWWPKTCVRRGKKIEYKFPERLIQKLLTYG